MESSAQITSAGTLKTTEFDDHIVRNFVWAALVWGAFALVVGLILAAALVGWRVSDAASASFGRLAPLHRSLALYAFVGNLLYAGVYYASQRLCMARIPKSIARFHFLLWQVAIGAGVVTLFAGVTQGAEYAEFEWSIDLALCLAALCHAAAIVGLVARRTQLRLPVAMWFFMAGALLFPLAYALGNVAIPTGLVSSVRFWGGPDDALVSWWFAEQAFAYLAIAPALGLAYFLMPRLAGRPLFSPRLAVLHFWSFVLLSCFAGPIHLLGSTLPASTQSLAVALTLIVWAPTAAAVINGVATLWGADGEHRAAPAHSFLLAAMLGYGVIALEGPLLGLRSVSPTIHFTDWVVGHTHLALAGVVSWTGVAALYHVVPRLFGTRLRSVGAAHAHLRLSILGLLLYVGSMWLAGATSGTMWQEESPYGGFVYTFLESVDAIHILRIVRLVGGGMLVFGFALMVWNLVATVRGASLTPERFQAKAREGRRPRLIEALVAPPVILALVIAGLLVVATQSGPIPAFSSMFVALVLATGGLALGGDPLHPWRGRLERRGLALGTLVVASAVIGSVLTLYPTLSTRHSDAKKFVPLSPLELIGQSVYQREGCAACHTQMIRPHDWEVARYGAASEPFESAYDHPAMWGSRRIGPDLARFGGKQSDSWHAKHLLEPRSTAPQSIMPSYAYLASGQVDFKSLPTRMEALSRAGVPYSPASIQTSAKDAEGHASELALRIRSEVTLEVSPKSELVALIAYLQRLGLASTPKQGAKP